MDRNDIRIAPIDGIIESLSARRAWIEIEAPTTQADKHASLSARRAWIEIINEVWANFSGFVALRKESVDRNLGIETD